ncbi:Lpg1974 family pore-forming outer membrane protein [Legionella yabuuchiae]|uniref:Lpg1974 family pore-forming outer membrane protein n=1 Tax=Legionella yabuuchiae TaxID=376727 RepID=UPI00105673E8|nr:Lpg1974 family pore-forming outer membrane protein [Legionella yabuuchiae]
MNFVQGKTFLLALLYSVSVAVNAGGDTKHNVSTIPEQSPGLGGSIGGLYIQPSANNLEYAVYTIPLPLPAPNWYQQSVKPDYAPGFTLGVHYNFESKQDQVKLDWLHFQNTDSANFSAEPNTSVGPESYFGPTEQFLLNTAANSTVKFNIDHVNLVLSHFLNLNDTIQLELLLGASAAYLKEDIKNNYSGRDPVFGPYTHRVYTDSSLTGFGPRLAVEGRYFVNNHFGANVGIGSSLFVGSLSSSTNFTSWTANTNGPTNSTPTNTTLSNQRQTVVVPEIDGNIGLFYTTTFNQNSTLTFQLGYLFQDYINSIYQVLPSSLVPTAWEAGTVAIISQTQRQSDLSMNGPYIKLVYK